MIKLKIDLPFPKWLLFFTVFVLFVTFYRVCFVPSKSMYQKNTKVIKGTVISVTNKNQKFSYLLKTPECVQVYTSDIIKANLGDLVEVKGTLMKPSTTAVFHVFQYDTYLKGKGIYWIMQASSITIVKKNTNWYYRLKRWIQSYCNTFSTRAYLKLLILGDDSEMDPIVRTHIQSLGMSHLFAISGMHVVFLSRILLSFFSLFASKKESRVITSLFLIFYSFLVDMTPSVIRAVTVTVIAFFFPKISKLTILLLLFNLLLLYQPFYCYQLSFLFSFIVSFHLLLFQDWIFKTSSYFGRLFRTNVIATLSSFPIVIYHSFSFPLFSICYTMLFLPFVFYFLYPVLLLSIFLPKFTFLAAFFIRYFEALVTAFASHAIMIPFCRTFLFFYLGYYVVLLWHRKKSKRNMCFCFLVLVLVHSALPYFRTSGSITMLDVGQGDSFYIERSHHRGSILIDTGGTTHSSSIVSYRTIPYLKSRGTSVLDALILTHGDADHMGDAKAFISSFPVRKVYMNAGASDTLEKELITFLKQHKIPYQKISQAKVVIAGVPFYFLNQKNTRNENKDSLVCYTKIDRRNILFMGDASSEEENHILNTYLLPDMDILKLGHHGSKTSSSMNFLKEMNPRIALISVGQKNRYGHPHSSVLNRLSKQKIPYYRTDLNGTTLIRLSDLRVMTYYS